MRLTFISQSLLQHVIAQLKLAIEILCLPKFLLIAGQRLSKFIAIIWIELVFGRRTVEVNADFKLEALQKADVVFILSGKSIVALLQVFDCFYMIKRVLLIYSSSRLRLPFYRLKLANSLLNVLFWRLRISDSLSYGL